MDERLNKKRAFYYIVLTFFFSYLLAGAYYLSGGRIQDPGFMVMAVFYMFIPMMIAIFLQRTGL